MSGRASRLVNSIVGLLLAVWLIGLGLLLAAGERPG